MMIPTDDSVLHSERTLYHGGGSTVSSLPIRRRQSRRGCDLASLMQVNAFNGPDSVPPDDLSMVDPCFPRLEGGS